jgi:hypothetical protein
MWRDDHIGMQEIGLIVEVAKGAMTIISTRLHQVKHPSDPVKCEVMEWGGCKEI